MIKASHLFLAQQKLQLWKEQLLLCKRIRETNVIHTSVLRSLETDVNVVEAPSIHDNHDCFEKVRDWLFSIAKARADVIAQELSELGVDINA